MLKLQPNAIRQAELAPAAEAALLKLQQVMTVGEYSRRSIINYVRDLRVTFEYYPDTDPASITAEQIE